MWLADKIKEFEQRIEKLEQDTEGLKQENEKLIKHLWALPIERKTEQLGNSIDEAKRALNEAKLAMGSYTPKPHYTRGQQVIVFCAGDYVNWWKDAIYLEKLKEDVHLVFIQETSKLGQFPDRHIRPLSKPEKPAFTRGQEVEVQMITGWTKGLMVEPDEVMSIVYVDEKRCSLPFMNADIRPITQTTEG